MKNAKGEITSEINISEDAWVEIEFEVIRPGTKAVLVLGVCDSVGDQIFASFNNGPENPLYGVPLQPGRYRASCRIYGNLLNDGRFYLTIAGMAESFKETTFTNDPGVASLRAGPAAPVELQNTYGNLSYFDPTVRERLVTFLDNHDNSRFQGAGIANQDQSRARAALAWLLTSDAIPCVYYGTEQEFDGGGDPWCREDMWDGQWILANGRRWSSTPAEVQKLLTQHITDAVIKQRDDIRRLNNSLEGQLKAKGMVFNTPDPKSFRDALAKAGFYAEWRGKFGADAMAKLEKYSGKLG